jgi:integrase
MEWREVPKFFKEVLDTGPSNPTRALLKFVVLTASRSGEARFMNWSEVDLVTKVWTIPATRMKAKALHRVPLSDQVVALLERQATSFGNDGLVFPAPRGGALSDMAMSVFLRGKNTVSSEPGRTATAHGFRSSFRDWASENSYARDLAERALAHTIANQAEAAYHRTDLLEQRRSMMAAWAIFCTSG